MNKLLASSQDENKLSLTIKSIGVWLIPALLALITYFGWDITKNDLIELVNNLAILAATVMSVYGIGRKIYYKLIRRNN